MDVFDFSILGPAFVAGLLVLASHIPLGQEVLKRGIIFIDLAIAQIIGFGIILASRIGLEAHGWEVQLIAIVSALIGAWGISLLRRYESRIQEALIGVVFVLAATGSVLLLTGHPQGGEHLKELLLGQILWTTWSQLVVLAVVTGVVLLLWFKFKKNVRIRHVMFYFLLAIAVTSSVQLVGVYLVFASLIIPALGSSRYTAKKSLVVGYTIGVLGYGLGLILSLIFDVPSGAIIVWTMGVAALLPKLLCDLKTSFLIIKLMSH